MKKFDKSLSPVRKIEIRVVYGMLVIIALIFALLAYWIFMPVKTLAIQHLPLPVTNPEDISSGRIIVLRFDYCKYTSMHGRVERKLVSDRLTIDLPIYMESLQKGCHKLDAPIILPYTVATQTFYIHYHVVYQVNPLRSEIVEFDTKKFKLLPAPAIRDQSNAVAAASDVELLTSTLLPIPTPLPTTVLLHTTEILLPKVQNTTTQSSQAGASASKPAPTSAPKPTPVPTPTQVIQQVVETVKHLLNLK